MSVTQDFVIEEDLIAVEPTTPPETGSPDSSELTSDAPSTRNAALALAAEGFHVFPLPPRHKRATMPQWQKRATSDRTEVEKFFPVPIPDELIGSTECNIGIVGGRGLLVLDIDPRHGGDASLITMQKERGHLPPTRSVRTPSGGQHLYFKVPADRHVPNSTSKLGAGLDVKGDAGYVAAPPSVTDVGTYYWENPGAQIADAPAWLIALATEPRKPQPTPFNDSASPASETSKHNLTLDDAREMLRHLDPNSDYTAWFDICVAMRRAAKGAQDGSTEAQWFEALNDWSGRGAKYAGREDVAAKWHQADTREHGYGVGHLISLATAGGWEAPPLIRTSDPSDFKPVPEDRGAPPLEHLLLTDFMSTPEPDWLIEELLLLGSVLAVVYAAPGAGKSTLVLELLMAIARGLAWHGRAVEQEPGCVAYLAAESVVGLRKRLKAYAKANGVEFDSLNDKFFPVPSGLNLNNPEDVEELIQYLKTLPTRYPLRAIAIDTLAQATPGANENSSEDMGAAINACKRIHKETGALVILIAHSGKQQHLGIRGWSGIVGALDTEIELTWDPDTKTGTVTAQKVRDGESFQKLFDFELRRIVYGTDKKGREASSVVIAEVEAPLTAKPTSEMKQMTMRQPKTTRRAAKPVLDTLRAAMRVMTVQELMDIVAPQLTHDPQVDKRDQRRGEVKLAIDTLRDEGFVKIRDNVVTFIDPQIEGSVSSPVVFTGALPAANDVNTLASENEEISA